MKAKKRWHGCNVAARLSGAGKRRRLAVAALFDDLRALYHTRFDEGKNLYIELDSPQLVGFGQRTQLLACLSLWLDRTLDIAAGLRDFTAQTQIFAREENGWLSVYINDNVPLIRCVTPTLLTR